jgi:hypothetical protein
MVKSRPRKFNCVIQIGKSYSCGLAISVDIQTILFAAMHFFWCSATFCFNSATIWLEGSPVNGDSSRIGVLHMKKFLVLVASVSVLALAGCNKAEEKAAAPAATTEAAPAAATPAAEPAAPAAATPAAEPAAPAAEPAAPAAAPAAPAADAMAPAAIDPAIQTMIDQAKTGAAAMTAEQKTAALAGIRTAAETAATTAGAAAEAVKAAGDAAEAAAKTALGM